MNAASLTPKITIARENTDDGDGFITEVPGGAEIGQVRRSSTSDSLEEEENSRPSSQFSNKSERLAIKDGNMSARSEKALTLNRSFTQDPERLERKSLDKDQGTKRSRSLSQASSRATKRSKRSRASKRNKKYDPFYGK